MNHSQFRNLTILRIHPHFFDGLLYKLDHLDGLVEEPGPLVLRNSGFVPLYTGSDLVAEQKGLSHSVILRHREYTKLIPAAVVKARLEKWIEEYKNSRDGSDPHRVEIQEAKEKIALDLDGAALVKYSEALMIRTKHIVIVTSHSANRVGSVKDDYNNAVFDAVQNIRSNAIPPDEEIPIPYFQPYFHESDLKAYLNKKATSKEEGLHYEVDFSSTIRLKRSHDDSEIVVNRSPDMEEQIIGLVNDGYQVVELPLENYEFGVSFSLLSSGKVSNFKLSNIHATLSEEVGEDDSDISDQVATIAIFQHAIEAMIADIDEEVAALVPASADDLIGED